MNFWKNKTIILTNNLMLQLQSLEFFKQFLQDVVWIFSAQKSEVPIFRLITKEKVTLIMQSFFSACNCIALCAKNGLLV